jgi:hypothetical protein
MATDATTGMTRIRRRSTFSYTWRGCPRGGYNGHPLLYDHFGHLIGEWAQQHDIDPKGLSVSARAAAICRAR